MTRILVRAKDELKRLTRKQTEAWRDAEKSKAHHVRGGVDDKLHADRHGGHEIDKAPALVIAELSPGRHDIPKTAPGYIITLPRSVWKEFGTAVDAIISTSPSLLRRIHDITREGWTIRYGQERSGTQTIAELKRIIIDPSRKGDPLQTAVAIAYETGHTLVPFTLVKPGPREDREEWVQYHLGKIYKSEARAHWSLQQAQSESASRGGPLVGIGSTKYGRDIEKIYNDAGGKMSYDAIKRIAELTVNGEVGDWHDPPPPTFAEHYRKLLEKLWEKY